MNWDSLKKPPLNICPEEFCFFWKEKGSGFALGLYNNLDEALMAIKPVEKSFCGCNFGKCIRNKENIEFCEVNNWYEPSEPVLEKAGLPWFYFINPEKLKKKDKKMYEKYFK